MASMDFSCCSYSNRYSINNDSNSDNRDSVSGYDKIRNMVKTTVVKTYGKKDRIVFCDADGLKNRNVFNNSIEDSPDDPFDKLFKNSSNSKRSKDKNNKSCNRNQEFKRYPRRKQFLKKRSQMWDWSEQNTDDSETGSCISPKMKKRYRKNQLKEKETRIKEPQVKIDPRYNQDWSDIENTSLEIEIVSTKKKQKSSSDVNSKFNQVDIENETTLVEEDENDIIDKTGLGEKSKRKTSISNCFNDFATCDISSKKNKYVQVTSTPNIQQKKSLRLSGISPVFACELQVNNNLTAVPSTPKVRKEHLKECAVMLTRLNESLLEKVNGSNPRKKSKEKATFERFDNLCETFEKMSTVSAKKKTTRTRRLLVDSDLSDISEENEDAISPVKASISTNQNANKHSFRINQSKYRFSSIVLQQEGQQQSKRSLSPDFAAYFNRSGRIKIPRLTMPTSKVGDFETPLRRTTLLMALTPHDCSVTGKSICGFNNVLIHCGQEKPIVFSNFMKNYKNIMKIDEGSYGEVFKATNRKNQEVVLKIQAIRDDEENCFDSNWPEVVSTCRLCELRHEEENRTENFIRVNKIACLQGIYPRPLLKAWNDYATKIGTECDKPSNDRQQMYLGYEIENGGINLESYKFFSMAQAVSVFLQIATALAVAEIAVQFEHRDLHWGNILVNATQETFIPFILNGNTIRIKSHKVKATLIDFGLSRLQEDCAIYVELDKQGLMEGEGDYQFDIYREMQYITGNNWEGFYPKTNVFWLHYLIDKLCTWKKYQSKSQAHMLAKTQLDDWCRDITKYNSAEEFVMNNLHLYT